MRPGRTPGLPMLQPGGRERSWGGRILFREAIENIDELREALGPFRLPLLDPFGDALLNMEFEHGETDAIQRGFRCGQLLQDLDAQPRFLDHAADAAYLPLDAVQACHQRLLL